MQMSWKGRFQRITPDEIVDEMEIFLKNVDSPGTVFRTNHASNYVILAGTLNGDIPAMLKKTGGGKENASLPEIPGDRRSLISGYDLSDFCDSFQRVPGAGAADQ